ncbi:MAG: glycosyltransferase family 4 protein [Candidatus Latescibacterota bacterium]|nr:glycosyltransferase family 4 protein [Candidatus Latescibacterota bacterium]
MDRRSRVYFIACCFPPFGRGNSITNSCVANHLAEEFDVEVVCMELKDGGVIAYQEDQSLAESLHDKLEVTRVPAANWYGLNIALYALGVLPCYFLNWAWRVWRRRERIFKRPGTVFAVYPIFSDLVLGYWLSKCYGWPLLVDFRDDFSGVMARGWRRVFKPFYRWLEKKIIAAADTVTVTTEALRQDILDRYGLAADKVVVVYNIVPPAPSAARKVARSDETPLKAIYAGALSQVQKPEILLKAYARLLQRDAIWSQRLQVELYGPESPYYKARIAGLLTRGCSFGGFKPQVDIAERVAAADIGFFSLSDATYAYATPTKLFDYIEAGLPIVAALPPGASRALIERHQIGLVADPADVEGLADCLQRMVGEPALRRRCRDYMADIRQQFRSEAQVGKWAAALRAIELAPEAQVVREAVPPHVATP